MINLFIIDEFGDYELNRNELMLIPEFKALSKLKLDKRRKVSDAEKDNKHIFKFMYFYCNYASPYVDAGYTDKIRFEKALKETKLPDTWKPNEVVQAAIDKYESIQNVGSIKLLKMLTRGLYTSTKVTEVLTEHMHESIERISDLDPSNEIDKADFNEEVRLLMNNIDRIKGIAKDIPKIIDELEGVRKKVAIEVSEAKERAGGGAVGEREDVDYKARLKKRENSNITDEGIVKLSIG